MLIKPLLTEWNFMFHDENVTTGQRNEIAMQFLDLVEDNEKTSFSPDYDFIIRGRVFGHKDQKRFPDRIELFSAPIIKVGKVMPDSEERWVGKHTKKEESEETPFYVITNAGERFFFFMSGQHDYMVKMMEDAKNGTLSLEPRAYLPKQTAIFKEWI